MAGIQVWCHGKCAVNKGGHQSRLSTLASVDTLWHKSKTRSWQQASQRMPLRRHAIRTELWWWFTHNQKNQGQCWHGSKVRCEKNRRTVGWTQQIALFSPLTWSVTVWLMADTLAESTHTHTHTHPFNDPFSGSTRVSRYQKGKTNLDFTEARDSEWQWHQLGLMQACTSLQTDNHASTPPLRKQKALQQ